MTIIMQNQFIDGATRIREGEELNKDSLLPYLSSHLENVGNDIDIKQFPSGFSNLTYLITIADKEYVLRRPPFGVNIKSAHDMDREFKVLSLLEPIYPSVPSPILYCKDESIIGAPFYLMDRIKGIILRNKPPEGISLSTDLMRSISESAIDNLAALHAIDVNKTGLIDLGKPEGYIQRQVDGWTKRYYNAQTDKIDYMDLIAKWMISNIPTSGSTSFIHNDYKYDNLVLNPRDLSEIIAVLDWEMATVGDPLMDLGTTLAYWAEENDNPALKPFNLTWLKGNMTRSEVIERYALQSGRNTSDILFYYVFGTFKIAVIVQQIYARFKNGHTKDARFAGLIQVVNACADNGFKAMNTGQII